MSKNDPKRIKSLKPKTVFMFRNQKDFGYDKEKYICKQKNRQRRKKHNGTSIAVSQPATHPFFTSRAERTVEEVFMRSPPSRPPRRPALQPRPRTRTRWSYPSSHRAMPSCPCVSLLSAAGLPRSQTCQPTGPAAH